MSQPPETIVFSQAPHTLEPAIPFLSQPPQIDGVLDANLESLPPRTFNAVIKTNPQNPAVAVNYRLAYGADFFYLYIDFEAERYTCRDRGYQNGDGFILALTVPRPQNEPTDEFYVMGFSAQENPRSAWAKKILWYRNVDTILGLLGKKIQCEVKAERGHVGFELLLPWSEVYPYHPWLLEAIGFNLCFVKAIGDTEQDYYMVVADNIGAEQCDRLYTRLRFKEPHLEQGFQAYMVMDRHCNEGETAKARFATLSADAARQEFRLYMDAGEGGTLNQERFSFECLAGLGTREHGLKTSQLIPGGYRVRWRSFSHDSEGEVGLTVLPTFDFDRQEQQLATLKDQISTGSYATLQFKLQQIHTKMRQLKPYDTWGPLRIEISKLLEILEKAEIGKDALASMTGIFRRAFRSAVDDTLQPYSIKVPDDYDPARTYPLLVFLHGSGVDDRGILETHNYLGQGNFIELAPLGRGTSNAYSADHAQDDIREAIEDVIRNYPIDTDCIVLGGFSMGGYGVYRTYYETPETFKALAVFAGHPNCARAFSLAGEHPNFLEEKYQEGLERIPIFVYHGNADRNAPFELTAKLVEQLKSRGVKVEFLVEEGIGHNPPGKETIKAYHRWLEKVLGHK